MIRPFLSISLLCLTVFSNGALATTPVADSDSLGSTAPNGAKQILRLHSLPIPASDYSQFKASFEAGATTRNRSVRDLERGISQPLCFVIGGPDYTDGFDAYDRDLALLKLGRLTLTRDIALRMFSGGFIGQEGRTISAIEFAQTGVVSRVACFIGEPRPVTVGDLRQAFGSYADIVYAE